MPYEFWQGRAMIIETLLTTVGIDGAIHLAPMGLTITPAESASETLPAGWSLAPFAPSRSLDNLRRRRTAVINLCDDVRIFAGCLTGRRDWPTVPLEDGSGEARLAAATGFHQISVTPFGNSPVRPRFCCTVTQSQQLQPFVGFCRAQAAVIEAAILVSRFNRTPARELEADFQRLGVIIEKTAGPAEFEAWSWIMDSFQSHLTHPETGD
ncbi:MAG: DUF447 family protein [Alphaproteobacteria bacterium]|nr:DUF447 family protein [Alphaproteobacteria bacterium]